METTKAELFAALWRDRTIRSCDIASRMGMTVSQMYEYSRRLQLPPRGLPPGGIKDAPLPDLVDDGEAEPHEDSEGLDSLRLDPWVAKRAAVVRAEFLARASGRE